MNILQEVKESPRYLLNEDLKSLKQAISIMIDTMEMSDSIELDKIKLKNNLKELIDTKLKYNLSIEMNWSTIKSNNLITLQGLPTSFDSSFIMSNNNTRILDLNNRTI